MPIPDDDQQFEAELRRFAPREVEPLHPAWVPRFRWRGPMAVAAAVVLAAIGILLRHEHRAQPTADLRSDAAGLTLGRAQAALVVAPSFEEAIDGLERTAKPPKKAKLREKQSALEALGREE